MTYKEYLQKRKDLMDKVNAQIESNTKESLEEADRIMYEVRILDADYETEANERLANERALSDEYNSVVRAPWMTGSCVDFVNHRSYPTNNMVQDKLFLNNGSMTDRIKATDPNAAMLLNMDGALGSVVRGMVTGRWDRPELKNVVTTTSSGTLIPAVLSAQIIDQMRDFSLFTAAGVPVAPMESNNLTISRVKTDPTFSFKEEGEEATESSFELDGIELKAKTAYGYAYVTLEAIQSSKNLDAVLRQVFAAAMANAIDIGMLYGQKNGEGFDSFAPSGIMNDADILTIPSGDAASYDDIVKAAGKIRRANGVPTAWAVNAAIDEALDLLKDLNGQYLTPPASMGTMNKIVSNQLAYDETTGSDGLVFDPTAMIIGLQNSLVIKIIEDEKCLKNGLVGFQIYSMLDCKTVRPKAICKITGMK